MPCVLQLEVQSQYQRVKFWIERMRLGAQKNSIRERWSGPSTPSNKTCWCFFVVVSSESALEAIDTEKWKMVLLEWTYVATQGRCNTNLVPFISLSTSADVPGSIVDPWRVEQSLP